MLFARERRASEDLGHLKATEVGALMGKQWRELPENEKKVCYVLQCQPH